MKAKLYSRRWIRNYHLRLAAVGLQKSTLISNRQLKSIHKEFPAPYHLLPDGVSAGLFFLTLGFVYSVTRLLWLVAGSPEGRVFFSVFFGLIGVVALVSMEWIVHRYKIMHAGIDDALQVVSMGTLFAAVVVLVPFPEDDGRAGLVWYLMFFSIFLMVFALIWARRYQSGIFWLFFVVGFLILAYDIVFELIQVNRQYAVLVLMVFILANYFALMQGKKTRMTIVGFRQYQFCRTLLLIALYFVGNRYMAFMVSKAMKNMGQNFGDSFLFSDFHWLFTAFYPIVCIALGIVKKDSLLIRVGSVLSPASLLIYQIHFFSQSVDAFLIVFGVVLVIIAYIGFCLVKNGDGNFTMNQSGSAFLDESGFSQKLVDISTGCLARDLISSEKTPGKDVSSLH